MKMKKIFLLLMLTLLFVGLSYATELPDDTTTDTSISDTTDEIVQSSDIPLKEVDNTLTDEKNTKKEIIKEKNNTVKTASSKTYTVNDFNTLHKVLTSNTYNTLTLNIKSNIILEDDTTLNKAIKTLNINGNGKTINGNNQYQFLWISTDSTVTIKNLKIINCHSLEDGGAINNEMGTLNIINSTLKNNTAGEDYISYSGGAISNDIGTITIINSTINNNYAYSGGAIYNNLGTVKITNTTINHNDAMWGGATYNHKGTLTITNCKIKDNSAVHYGGAINNGGNLNITNTILNNNYVTAMDDCGGAIYNNKANITINKSTLNNNHAYHGGAIHNDEGNITISKSTLNNNKASGIEYVHFGGAIYNSHGKLNIINSTLNNNKATSGGAISNKEGNITISKSTLNNNKAIDLNNIYRSGYDYMGGAIRNYLGVLNIVDSTLNNNRACQGGAIINDEGNITISKSTLNNNTANGTEWISTGGAILNNIGSLKIFNSTLNNNSAIGGGAIDNNDTVSITDSTLNNNKAEYDGGAIINDGELTITKVIINYNKAETGGAIYNNGPFDIINSLIENNQAYEKAGAIFNNGGAVLNIINSQLENNYLNEESWEGGGAIDNWGTLNIRNSTFKNNNANNAGGAIFNTRDLNITNSSFINNIASSGGAILNSHTYMIPHIWTTMNVYITNSILDNNQAEYDGGAICSAYSYSGGTIPYTDDNNLTIINCTIKNNKANGEGGAISKYEGNLIIKKTIFINNTSNMTGKAINCSGKGKISNNINAETSKCSGTIYVLDSNVIIKNNTFYDYEIKSTAITLEHTKTVTIGDQISIYGKLTDNKGNNLAYQPVKITVDGKTYKTDTTKYGNYNIKITPTSVGTKKIKVTYAGDKYNLACSNSTSFKVKQPTWIKMAYIGNVKYGSTVKLVGRLLNGSNAVKYVPVNITVNGKTYKVKTDGAGYFRLNYTVKSYDNQKVTFKFAGNTLYAASSNSTTFKIKQPTYIKHASIGNVKQGTVVLFVGRVMYNETTGVKYVPVNVAVNGKVYTLKADGAGYFRLNYTTTTVGTVTFTSKFDGNSLYLASSNSSKFTVVKS